MSPLEVSILLHYHISPDDYRNGDFTAPAVAQFMENFCDIGLLEKNWTDGIEFRLTERGKEIVRAICDTPLPLNTWVKP